MSLKTEEVKKIAQLSRLYYTDEEIEEMGPSFNTVMAFIDELTQLELDDVEPLTHPSFVENNFREDKPEKPYNLDAIISQTLEIEDGYLRVPSVLAESEGGHE
ncbi:MAG: Asp-tRNA(Asn)/Glu-tRNA(Gln) amidotransferase subunit GatC [Culicoidibacterales bacterium]